MFFMVLCKSAFALQKITAYSLFQKNMNLFFTTISSKKNYSESKRFFCYESELW